MILNVAKVVRPVDDTDFSDITTAKITGPSVWVAADQLDVPFDRALSASEVSAVVRRLTTVDEDREAARRVLEEAAAINAAYLARVVTPTPADSAQIKALTRQMNALLKLIPQD